MRRVPILLLTLAALVAGCGDDGPSPFAERAERACRDLDRDGFREQVEVRRAYDLYRRFTRAITAARPEGDEEDRARNALLRYGDGNTQLFAGAPTDAPTVDLKLTVGTPVSDLIAVREAGLSRCTAVLKGESRYEDGQVIR